VSRRWLLGFALASAALAIVVLVGIGREANRPWREIQRAQGKQPPGGPGVVEIEAPLGVERCLTCHHDLAAAPDAAHAALLDQHPPLFTGCVACHGGDGRALEPSRAHARSGPERLDQAEWIPARCAICHPPGTVDDEGVVLAGLLAYDELGCGVCHRAGALTIAADRQGGFGPDLDDAGRFDPAALLEMIREPSARFGADTSMPPFAGALDAQPTMRRPLLAFLQTLRRGRVRALVVADTQRPCVGCHAAMPAAGLERHRCSLIIERAETLRCDRCHALLPPTSADSGGVLAVAGPPDRRARRCPVIDAQRPLCAACHHTARMSGGGARHGS